MVYAKTTRRRDVVMEIDLFFEKLPTINQRYIISKKKIITVIFQLGSDARCEYGTTLDLLRREVKRIRVCVFTIYTIRDNFDQINCSLDGRFERNTNGRTSLFDISIIRVVFRSSII